MRARAEGAGRRRGRYRWCPPVRLATWGPRAYGNHDAVRPVVGVLGGEPSQLGGSAEDEQLLVPCDLVARRKRKLDGLGVHRCGSGGRLRHQKSMVATPSGRLAAGRGTDGMRAVPVRPRVPKPTENPMTSWPQRLRWGRPCDPLRVSGRGVGPTRQAFRPRARQRVRGRRDLRYPEALISSRIWGTSYSSKRSGSSKSAVASGGGAVALPPPKERPGPRTVNTGPDAEGRSGRATHPSTTTS